MANENSATNPSPGSGAGEAGWPVLHMFHRLDRTRWNRFEPEAREAAVSEFEELLARLFAEEGLQVLVTGVIGKADLGITAIHPGVDRVQRLTQEVAATALGSCLEIVYSFLSISEKSEYISTAGDQARKLIDEEGLAPDSEEFRERIVSMTDRLGKYAEMRLRPTLPDSEYPVVCFYPMSKKREEEQNWYALSFEERKRLMGSHATAGRRFAGRVTQLITSSTGLDDWEWGVTLFARDLKAIRDIVYEMRYDEGSALYGLFGPFYLGVRIEPGDLRETLKL